MEHDAQADAEAAESRARLAVIILTFLSSAAAAIES
jgi:hypothetical protein